MNETAFSDQLSTLNISELRAYARNVGVSQPSSKKQAQLITEIIEISAGRQAPCVPSKRGRPPKAVKEISQICDDAPVVAPVGAVEQPNLEITPIVEEKQSKKAPEANANNDIIVDGILEVMPDGYGFLRAENYHSGYSDVYVPPLQVKRFNLKSGDKIECKARVFTDKQAPSLIFIFKINDIPCGSMEKRSRFEDLISCYPSERLKLECSKTDYSLRLIDLVAPIGKGQRGLIVAAPKTGKTILLKKIAQAICKNHPEVYMIVLLIDERPEEVTDFKQSVDCDVVCSTFDQTPQHHVQVADLVIRNAKRRVEMGQDVMILLDSITRLGRAYNQTAAQSGRTLTGGLDVSALQEPKKFFGAGRNIEGKGSLTILATALIDTGSKMDDIIYEEFKGTGNMEIHLDRRMSERRIFPAIDLAKSGTRREELLLTQNQLEGMWLVRRALSRTDTMEATEQLLDILMTTENNEEFINLLKVLAKKQKTRRENV